MERQLKDVCIISDNIISSLGFTTHETMEAVLRGESGIRLIDDATIYPEPFQAGKIDAVRLQTLRKEHALLNYSLFDSLAILSVSEALQRVDIDMADEKTLLILSTTKGNIDCLSALSIKDLQAKNSQTLYPAYLWRSAQIIADYFGMTTLPKVISNACVSGVSAVEIAGVLLENNVYETIVVVGADLVTAFTVSGFQSFKSISPEPCKPYDIHRDGLSIGEGVGCLILTNQETFSEKEDAVFLLGGATSNDANHISGPSRTGDGLHYAIERAINQSTIEKEEIDFLNLHGTATIFNDEMESKALRLSALSDVPANSLKGYFGHTLGSSGIIEIIVCIESLKRGCLIATRGFTELGVSEPMTVIAENQKKEVHTFLKTASGFGGFNSAVIISTKKHAKKRVGKSAAVNVASCCQIANNQIIVNNRPVFENLSADNVTVFLKSAFKHSGISTMKFYKMDNLCKLGYLAVQYMLKQSNMLEKYDRRKVAILFSSATSSLDTDSNHQLTISNAAAYFPSPSVFVYTLPNIVLGEICISEKLQGETLCFVSERFEREFLFQYAELLFSQTGMEAAIIGTINCLGEKQDVTVYFIEKQLSL